MPAAYLTNCHTTVTATSLKNIRLIIFLVILEWFLLRTPTVQNYPSRSKMVTVTSKNFEEQIKAFEEKLKSCSFVAFDEEMTGIQLDP